MISDGTKIMIKVAYSKGLINEATYREIKKKYKI